MKNGIQKFSPSPEMISAAETVMLCMAAVETIRPVVHGYEKKILEKHQFTNLKEKDLFERLGREFEERIILDPKDSYLLSDRNFGVYHEECKAEMAKAKLKVEHEDDCPLLVAEELLRKAQRNLVAVMEPTTGLSGDDVLCTKDGLENYRKLIDLTLRLLAPFANPKLKVA